MIDKTRKKETRMMKRGMRVIDLFKRKKETEYRFVFDDIHPREKLKKIRRGDVVHFKCGGTAEVSRVQQEKTFYFKGYSGAFRYWDVDWFNGGGKYGVFGHRKQADPDPLDIVYIEYVKNKKDE